MGGPGPKCAGEDDDEGPPLLPQSTAELLSGANLIDSPILILVYFHKALLAELTYLRRIAVQGESGRVGDLRRRFEFLKFVYKYHCSAEDEVIFMALDLHIKNVVSTYTLEHKGIDDLFDSISASLNVLVEKEESTLEQFQEIVISIGTLRATLSRHMVKEEKQVFPLLMKQFSSKEQASLIWKFFSSVPVMLLESFLPWLTSFLSSDEQDDVVSCVREVVPKEELMQEVFISWLHKESSSSEASTRTEKGTNSSDMLSGSSDIVVVHPSKRFCGEKWLSNRESCKTSVPRRPIDGLSIWHAAISKDFNRILEELYQIQNSRDISTFSSTRLQLNFLVDILLFYSIALDKIFDPVVNERAGGYKCHFDESQIGDLQRFLYQQAQNGLPSCSSVEMLSRKLELLVAGVNKHLALLEAQVISFISKSCTTEFQLWLLYTSLDFVPLGLLKAMTTWFATHLSEDECNSILDSLKNKNHQVNNKAFAFLLYEWVRLGYSGKMSIEKFREDLQEMFNSKSSSLTESAKVDNPFPPLILNVQLSEISDAGAPQPTKAISDDNITQKYSPSYASRINVHIFSHKTSNTIPPLPKWPAFESGASSSTKHEPKPVDHILFFHKALKKDLEYFVTVSGNLGENPGNLMDLQRRFRLIRFLYQIHTDSEDEIAFPALEEKGKAANISQSYTIDHQLEVELFDKLSHILDEISAFHVPVGSTNTNAPNQARQSYSELCLYLHEMFIIMHRVLGDHVNREEIDVWPLFIECFSIAEQEKIIGYVLGKTNAAILQEMIPWLLAALTTEEQHAIISLWRKITKNTMFDAWLGEWWEGINRYDVAKVEQEPDTFPSWDANSLKDLSKYLFNNGSNTSDKVPDTKGAEFLQNDCSGSHVNLDDEKNVSSGNFSNNQMSDSLVSSGNISNNEMSDSCRNSGEIENQKYKELKEVSNHVQNPNKHGQGNQDTSCQNNLPEMSQEELESVIRRISGDSTLDNQKKASLIQKLLISRWVFVKQKSNSKVHDPSKNEEVPGQCASYRDPLKLTFGCKHYKRNCKLVAACCNLLYTCRNCHDEVSDHSMDRKATTKMMCMQCLKIQPVNPTCATESCNKLSMAKYFCRICKFFDDERNIYHCPYCNLCRLGSCIGSGLGVDYFHCMNCNACMKMSLWKHICIEKSLEDNCPICHEYIFTSSSPVKALPCGHIMHSSCFQDYTCTHYICPICSKSLGDMQVYFGMLDALLAEEKMPDEYIGQTQGILCNDCEKRGTASFHWLYRKCSFCGSYNTRLL